MDNVSTTVTPGLGGFLAFFLLAIVLWLLMRNMNKRLRRMRYLEEQRALAPQDTSAEGGAVDDQGNRHIVRDEGDDGEHVEDLVEPEPPR